MRQKNSIYSREWCDLVFANRNRAFGAYELRKGSFRRHVRALVTVVLLVVVAVLVPYMVVKTRDMQEVSVDEVATISKILLEEEVAQLPVPQQPSQPNAPAEKSLQEVAVASPIDGSTQIVSDGTLTQVGDKAQEGASSDSLSLTTERFVEAPAVPEVEHPALDEPVDGMPLFNGADPMVSFRKYITDNLKYPEKAMDDKVGGVVYVMLVIGLKGEVEKVQIVKGVEQTLDAAVLKVVSESKGWTAARQKGRPIKVAFTIPVVFEPS